MADARIINKFDVAGEHWTLEIEQRDGSLYFEMRDPGAPESPGGWVGPINAGEFLAALNRICDIPN